MVGKGDVFSMTLPVLLFSNIMIFPVLVLISIATTIAIPLIIRREFRALSTIAKTAEAIDIDRRGYRLPDNDIPREVQPLVHAVNGALKRLDDGYERHKRFILDAAHELRTPVAILQTRVETLLEGPARSRILADANRIGVLAEQLLDLQRLGGQKAPLVPLDLVNLCRSVVADMAPLAISQGYELSFEPEEDPCTCGRPFPAASPDEYRAKRHRTRRQPRNHNNDSGGQSGDRDRRRRQRHSRKRTGTRL